MTIRRLAAVVGALALPALLAAQTSVAGTRAPNQRLDAEYERFYRAQTGDAKFGSPLVDHLPLAQGVPTPKDVLGYYIGTPRKLTYYEDILKYYRALAAASPRVRIETIGRSDEGRELVVVWISSEANIRGLDANKANLAGIADPRGKSDAEVRQLIAQTKPHYHLMGGLHSGETGPSEVLMELAYRLVASESPFMTQIRDNVIVSLTPVADADGRDRNVDWFYAGLEREDAARADSAAGRTTTVTPGSAALPYWGKYVYHDNNRDINLSQVQMRTITNWYFTAHPPIIHDLHESLALLYTYSGGPPQNPNLDPLLFGELNFFANWELSQMTKWGMPGVYTHAFMDGWSPGYLGSVAYNHNGMMRMYETQSGRDVDPTVQPPAGGRGGAPGAGGRGAAGAGGRGGAGGAGGGAGAGGAAAAGAAGGAQAGAAAAAAGEGAGAGGGRGAAAGAGAAAGGAPIRAGVPTGRGGGQPREWYRGIPIPDGYPARFTRRNNANYMQTGVLSALQLTAMFPELVLENFYVKTRNSLQAGRSSAPYAWVFPVQRDMTKVAELMRILRLQGIEVGTLAAETKVGADTYPAGSYLVKLDQPYGRLAKNLLEKQDYPDPALRTYDDSGWSMCLAFNVTCSAVADSSILRARTTPVNEVTLRGSIAGSGTAGLAVAHLGSNHMITFRFRTKSAAVRVAEESFTAEGVTFPAGSFILTGSDAQLREAREAAIALGLTGAALSAIPTVRTHDADLPRIAIYTNWSGTQELGWYRHAFDQFGIPFELIYKEQVAAGNLAQKYDVILMATQTMTRQSVLAPPASRPIPYKKSDKYRYLGMYGETDDVTGGFGEAGVRAIEQFLSAGGTLITTLQSSRFPIDFGFARSVDLETPQGVNAQKPLIQAQVSRPDHPVFYGYGERIFPIKFGQAAQVFRVGAADQSNVLATYVGGDDAVLSGLMEGANNIRGRAFAVDIPAAYQGKGRVIMFANNPVYRWQNHGEFNMVFNSIINWNDVPTPRPAAATPPAPGGGGRGGD